MKNLLTSSFFSLAAADFARDVVAQNYYVFIGDHLSDASDSVATNIATDADDLLSTAFDNMLVAKKVQPGDVAVMFPRVVWTSGTVYPQYEPNARGNHHVIVESGASSSAYVCIDNNSGAASTISPTGTSLVSFKTSDGYIWKYLTTIASATYDRFKTSTRAPLVINYDVKSNAIPASVETIRVVDSGVGYPNHLTGVVSTADVVDPTHLRLKVGASGVNGMYNQCIIRMTSGPAVGEYRFVTAYNGATRTITINEAFSTGLLETNTYQINPRVRVSSDNGGATNAVAWAVIDSAASDSVDYVEILAVGRNHHNATATVVTDAAAVPTSPAVLRTIVSPAMGFGGDQAEDLNARSMGISSKFTDTDTPLPPANEFRSIGLLRNPQFNNVIANVANGTLFTVGEHLIHYNIVAAFLNGGVLAGKTLSGNAGSTFKASLKTGDVVRMVSSGGVIKLTTIEAVISDTVASTVLDVGTITGSIELVRVTGESTLLSRDLPTVTMNEVTSPLTAGTRLYGVTSRNTDTITAVTHNWNTDASYFMQATRLVGAITSGTIQVDQFIGSGSNGMIVHSVKNNGNGTVTVYGTNATGNIIPGVLTQASGGVLNVTAKYNGDVAVNRGRLVYLENVVPITRSPTKSETIKLVLEF